MEPDRPVKGRAQAEGYAVVAEAAVVAAVWEPVLADPASAQNVEKKWPTSSEQPVLI